LMNFSPNHAEMMSESISVRSALNDTYDQTCAPGMSNLSKNLNK